MSTFNALADLPAVVQWAIREGIRDGKTVEQIIRELMAEQAKGDRK